MESHEIIKIQRRTRRDLRHLLVHSSGTVAWRLWRRNRVIPCIGVPIPVDTYTLLGFLRKSLFLWKQGLIILKFSLVLDLSICEVSGAPKCAA